MATRKDCKYANGCASPENCSRCTGYEPKVCCICGKKLTGYGNDPQPINMENGAKCCDYCNITKVVIERLKMINKENK